MKRRRCLLIVLTLLIFCTHVALAKPIDQAEPVIKVGLLSRQSQLILSADTAFFLLLGKGETAKVFAAGEKVVLSVADGRLKVNNTPVDASIVRIGFTAKAKRGHDDGLEQLLGLAGTVNRQGHFAKLNGKRYRGVIEVRRDMKTGLTAVNIVKLEDYLYGVVPQEISPAWHIEALKAQAIAARSYAFSNAGKHQGQGYEVCTTVHCQVYGGRDAETDRTNQAVDETRGMMATFGGNVINAFFHASSGGHTEGSEHVWGTPYPYLRGVPDYDQQSPRFAWERRISAAELSALVQANGRKIGKLLAIDLSPLTRQPVRAEDRGVSGRVKTIKFIGEKGDIELSGANFSSLLGLPSSLFDISIVNAAKPVFAAAGKQKARLNIQPSDVLLISGRGSGHGIGLSQWGAKAMAEKFAAGDKQFYKRIISHYYPGAVIKKCY